MQTLPIDASIPELCEHIRQHRRLVLIAPPGAGKTTRVPPALVERLEMKTIVTQPRRIAAQSTAARMAEERSWELGDKVGYHVRFDRRSSPQTRLEVVTEGILLRRLREDPGLEGVDAVVLDEFHERSVQVDLLLAMLREVPRTAPRTGRGGDVRDPGTGPGVRLSRRGHR